MAWVMVVVVVVQRGTANSANKRRGFQRSDGFGAGVRNDEWLLENGICKVRRARVGLRDEATIWDDELSVGAIVAYAFAGDEVDVYA